MEPKRRPEYDLDATSESGDDEEPECDGKEEEPAAAAAPGGAAEKGDESRLDAAFDVPVGLVGEDMFAVLCMVNGKRPNRPKSPRLALLNHPQLSDASGSKGTGTAIRYRTE